MKFTKAITLSIFLTILGIGNPAHGMDYLAKTYTAAKNYIQLSVGRDQEKNLADKSPEELIVYCIESGNYQSALQELQNIDNSTPHLQIRKKITADNILHKAITRNFSKLIIKNDGRDLFEKFCLLYEFAYHEILNFMGTHLMAFMQDTKSYSVFRNCVTSFRYQDVTQFKIDFLKSFEKTITYNWESLYNSPVGGSFIDNILYVGGVDLCFKKTLEHAIPMLATSRGITMMTKVLHASDEEQEDALFKAISSQIGCLIYKNSMQPYNELTLLLVLYMNHLEAEGRASELSVHIGSLDQSISIALKQNIKKLLNLTCGSSFITRLAAHVPAIKEQIMAYVRGSFDMLRQNEDGMMLMHFLIEYLPDDILEIVRPYKVFETLSKYSKGLDLILELLEKTQNKELAERALVHYKVLAHQSLVTEKEALLGELATFIIDKPHDFTSPTYRHRARYFSSSKDLAMRFTTDNELKDIFTTFKLKEKELNQNGYYTFIHGQMNDFYFPEKLYTFLWGQRKKQPVDNFLYAHVKDLIETDDEHFEQDILRQCIQLVGTQKDSYNKKVDSERRKLVLFMNYAFFANTTNLGSSSADYVINNSNSPIGRKVELNAQDSFAKLGYTAIYEQYHNEIEQLAKEYENLCKHGNMLLIAIPKDRIQDHVYLAKSGGTRASIAIAGIGKTSDIKLIMETLLNNPEKIKDTDQIEFCLIMTQKNGGLDPSTGIQVHPLLSGNSEKLKELKTREAALFAKIKTAIEAQENAQNTALNRAAILTNHVVQSATQPDAIAAAKTYGRINVMLNHLKGTD